MFLLPVGNELASKNSALAVETRTIEGSYLDLQVTKFGRLVWLRIASYSKKNMDPTDYKLFKQTDAKPLYSLYRRIYITNQNGFTFRMDTDGQITITPFGSNIESGTGVNLSEIYITSD